MGRKKDERGGIKRERRERKRGIQRGRETEGEAEDCHAEPRRIEQ